MNAVDYPVADLENTQDLRNYQNWIMSFFDPYVSGHCLELGAGCGSISAHLLPHCDRLDLVEPTPGLARQLIDRFAGERVGIWEETLEAHLPKVPSQERDSVVMVNVLEHVQDDQAALAQCARVLRPGGSLLIFVPAVPWLYSRADHMLGHYRRYDRATLMTRVKEAGFQMVTCSHFDMVGVAAWGINFTLLGRPPVSGGLATLYDRMVVPWASKLERIIPPPIGKNLVLVARRL